MRTLFNRLLMFLPILVIIAVYYRWFSFNEIIGGDWPYLFKESLNNYYFLVPSWNTWQGNGLGGTNPIYFLQSFEYLTVFFANFFHIPWPVIYKVFWFGLFIVLSVSSSIYFLNVVLQKTTFWQRLIAATIFTTNTYLLMLVSGGQMGVALSYSVAPFVLGIFIKLIDLISSSRPNLKSQISNLKSPIAAGLILSLQVLFDPRIAFITMIAAAIYMFFSTGKNIINTLCITLYAFVVPGIITFLLHAFWMLPLIIFSQDFYQRFNILDTGTGIVKFLSFSSFSQSLSLLHPNWPENIFGKTYFMKPEFIAMAILAYVSLLTVSKIKSQTSKMILFFAFLGLLGAFLAKGANPPFGNIYLWLFENIPGFGMFRDPTKFYLLVALSYSVLIPYSLLEISRRVSRIKYQVLFVAFLAFWIISIHPAIFGQLGGTFKSHKVSKEYIELKDFLYKQPEFFRTLWIPRQQRFTFFSNIHPSVEAGSLFNATNSAEIISKLKEQNTRKFLSELSIKYVIVPYDSLGEFFLTDRKYDKTIPEKISKSLETIPWLKKIDGLGNIAIFQIPSPKDHFWFEKSGKISYKAISPTQYIINASTIHDQTLIFSEKYNSSWVLRVENKTIKSRKTSNNLNSFELKKGEYDLEIIFLQDEIYNYGSAISLVAFLGALFFIFKYRKSDALSN